MPTRFQRWCLVQFGRLPVTMTEIWKFHEWYARDQAAAEAARAELETVSTVDDLLKIGGQ